MPLQMKDRCFNFVRNMEMTAVIQARIAWELFFDRFGGGVLEEPHADYSGMIEGMEASELLALMDLVQKRLRELDSVFQSGILKNNSEPSCLYIDKTYNIRLDSPDGSLLPLRPLVKALFILFLKHPEGIRLKDRSRFESELADIYAVILPNTEPDCRRKRIRRMMDLTDNSFSEKTSVLNSRLDELFPQAADNYKVQGHNGYPRRIPLDPLKVVWL